MTNVLRKSRTNSGSRSLDHEPSSPAEEQVKVNELRAALGPLTGRAEIYATDACLKRYLRARNWNVKKSEQMLRGTLHWRSDFKPEEIQWAEVAQEHETGKMYRVNCLDEQGHTILVSHPTRQNTSEMDGHIKHLVYCVENAILNLPIGQEQIILLANFKGWGIKYSTPIKTAREATNILQNHYPERLHVAILFNPPRVFETFWTIVKPFLDPRSIQKVKFVYTKNPKSMKQVNELLLKDKLNHILDNPADYKHEDYAKLMEEDDMKSAAYWNIGEVQQPKNGDPASMMKHDNSTEVNNEDPQPVPDGETPVLESQLE
ncbi:hypothetical protein CY35_01G157400 [Sphagnum magellanicum]|nr:hypothetical protein CY35_01G157400 [Sphagnum magellanicum]KAH9576361.1 hypothetical protein CY35_01G157400 [Sphagnum magellanicum]KAH9576362.1 hypothetical protein CY35_01G157400 [Sphagnum magellanicum]